MRHATRLAPARRVPARGAGSVTFPKKTAAEAPVMADSRPFVSRSHSMPWRWWDPAALLRGGRARNAVACSSGQGQRLDGPQALREGPRRPPQKGERQESSERQQFGSGSHGALVVQSGAVRRRPAAEPGADPPRVLSVPMRRAWVRTRATCSPPEEAATNPWAPGDRLNIWVTWSGSRVDPRNSGW